MSSRDLLEADPSSRVIGLYGRSDDDGLKRTKLSLSRRKDDDWLCTQVVIGQE
jgi:hypothetical protein